MRDRFFQNNPFVETMDSARAREQQVRENSARLAESFVTVSTTGQGGYRFDNVSYFGVTFINRPYVAVAHVVNDNDLTNPNQFPVASGGVWKWLTNERGFYTGAWLYVSVYCFGATPNYAMEHDFTFTGVAVKDLPEQLLDL